MKTLSSRRLISQTRSINRFGTDDPIWLRTGTELESGGVYIDLASPRGDPFVAVPGQVAGSGNRYVARRDIAVARWNRLVQSAGARGPGQPNAAMSPTEGLGTI